MELVTLPDFNLTLALLALGTGFGMFGLQSKLQYLMAGDTGENPHLRTRSSGMLHMANLSVLVGMFFLWLILILMGSVLIDAEVIWKTRVNTFVLFSAMSLLFMLSTQWLTIIVRASIYSAVRRHKDFEKWKAIKQNGKKRKGKKRKGKK